ncbi:MAG: VIT domain-containing protein [Planctomycetota bacterium]|nr:VIT domain-containing protein [Planctomycetota bacterium]
MAGFSSLSVAGDTLTEDGRIGKVVDAQGLVAIKPVLADRWTPVCESIIVRPGDWLRTDLRGANAVSVRLVNETRVTLGPGGLVELIKPNRIRVSSGDIQIVPGSQSAVEVSGPDQQQVTIREPQIYRVEQGKLVPLAQEPVWLKSFAGAVASESIGSLVAKVEGRNVPLTVGYHKVSVDIRDQIARTVVEESFVNNTDGRLEGVFYFPLPQDASISGFGMWIGNELVEADVVEKQRAREIYEEILRERRDPGLLEWSGGNLFKARVFPIEAHAEKRIKITYTQVLPLRGDRTRYSYALQSEMLKLHPLRELAIDVKLNSVLPLANVSSPTHTVRLDQTKHSAHVEFTAQEYTPTRDFEVVVELDGKQSDVVLIPHRRGDDGYFMLQVTPSAPAGDWQREVLPASGPWDLLILADTSASLDAGARAAQAQFIAALLGSLTPKDTFNLAGCDVECDWVFDGTPTREGAAPAKPQLGGNLAFPATLSATLQNIDAARQFLADRVSLGWTDLDKAFAAALAKCGPNTKLIYVGDGAPTTGDADPVAFSKRLKQTYQREAACLVPTLRVGTPDVDAPRRGADTDAERPDSRSHAERGNENPGTPERGAGGEGPTCYAVSVGSTYEAVVLKTIASLGGGSLRQISGERGPQVVARELLAEIARPGIRDLKVEFKGFHTARVYPEELPNVPAGSQQIILGRYLPAGVDQEGEVLVTGTQANQLVRFAARVSLKDAEQGNSFIPRLWARMHLDSLLQQGTSPAIRDEIIALSEQYHLMTPYTSLLVLESDADRERFKVNRRFVMRDGEKFFAEGRDRADYELVQQQMKRAGTWRLGLRRLVLQQLSTLGRDPQVFQGQGRPPFTGAPSESDAWYFNSGGRMSGMGGGFGGFGGGAERPGLHEDLGRFSGGEGDDDVSGAMSGPVGSSSESNLGDYGIADEKQLGEKIDLLAQATDAESLAGEKSLEEKKERFADAPAEPMSASAGDWAEEPMPAAKPASPLEYRADRDYAGLDSYFGTSDRLNRPMSSSGSSRRLKASFNFDSRSGKGQFYYDGDYWITHQYRQWFDMLFPQLPAPPAKERSADPAQAWPAEARAIALSLLRTQQLAQLQGGLRFELQSDSFEVRTGELSSRSHTLALVSSKAWLVRVQSDGAQTTVQWCDGKERGLLSRAFQLGRLRVAEPLNLELHAWPLNLSGYVLSPLDHSYQGYVVTLKPQAKQQTLLVLKHPTRPNDEIHLLVDTARQVMLSIEHHRDGKVTSATKFEQFVEIAGAWWANRVVTVDDQGRPTSVATQKFTEHAADVFTQRMQEELAGRAQVQFLHEPPVALNAAKKALAAGKADFDDQLTLLMHFVRSQQWTRVLSHLEQAEKLAADKPGLRWVRSAILNISRHREELKTRLVQEATNLAKLPADEQLFLANHVLGQASGILEANEMLALLESLKPIFERQPPHLAAMQNWLQQRISQLQQTGQAEAALKLQRQAAEQHPRNYSLQQQYAQALANVGDYAGAYAWLTRVIDSGFEWPVYELESLRNTYTQLLQGQGRYEELADYLAGWLKQNPDGTTVYQQYLSALVRLDRVEQANELIAQWLKEGQVPGTLPQPVASRLYAAVQQTLGQGYNLYTDRIDERWLKPLADAALFFARHPTQASTADQIMSHGRFVQSDPCRRVRKAVLEILKADVEKLTPEEAQRLVGWIMSNDPAVEQDVWHKLADRLRRRWSAESDPEVKQRWAPPLNQILSGRLPTEEWLAFLRLQYQHGPEKYRLNHVQQLFDALLGQPWSAKYEDEAFALLDRIADPDLLESSRHTPCADPAHGVCGLLSQLAALHRWTDRMVQARYQNLMQQVEHQEQLTRIELRTRQQDNQRLAREGLADRLAKELRVGQAFQPDKSSPKPQPDKRQPGKADLRERQPGKAELLRPWINVERLYLETLLGRNLKHVEEECWETLGPQPRPASEEDDPQLALDEILHNRCLLTLANLAARKGAEPASIDRLLKYIDQALGFADAEAPRWKLLKYELLIALDRPKDLEAVLTEWIKGSEAANRWRQALGYLLAEQGQLKQAIGLFEAIEKADELGPTEYRSLADWYLAVKQKDRYERAKIAAYAMLGENNLYRLLASKLRPWQRGDGHLPSELDKEVLLVFAALFEKASQPQNYLWQLREFYVACRDFRLPAGLADAVVGHTAGQVYPFLQNLNSILAEVRDEATADSIVEQIAKVRKRAKTDVDHRALDLLELLVERRAAELLNQPGPHAGKALAALQRAFKRSWSSGEHRLMADFLGGLGAISQPKLAEAQVQQLQTLHKQQPQGSADRLHIAWRLAEVTYYYGRRQEAVDLLQANLDEHQQAHDDMLPVQANDPLDRFVYYLEETRHFARGEQVLFDQLKHPAGPQQTLWLTRRLYQRSESATRNDGDVSLGSKDKLYRATEQRIQADLATPDNSHRAQLVQRLCSIYPVAHAEKKFAGVSDDLRTFAFKQLPTVLKRQTNDYQSLVSQVAETLRQVAGARDSLAFLIERLEQEPRWFRYNYQDGWNQFAWRLGEWRAAVKDLGELEPRLLKIVLAELRRDLDSRQSRNRSTYDRRHGGHFWAEQIEAFAKTAEEVLAERKSSGAAATYIADYLYHSLDRHDRGIEILLVAHREKLLDESGQSQLIQWLHERQRHSESIAILQPLIELRPDNIQYRVWLMHAYFHTGQQHQLLAILEQADKYFHEGSRWTEPVLASLAHGCLETQLYEPSVKYYQELIPWHQRTQPRRGIGNGTLSSYYAYRARAYAGLQQTAEAVEAACGAIVSWGPRHDQRTHALDALRQVLRESADLDAYVSQLDKQTAENGQDTPLVRKALGQVLSEKSQWAKAVVQLKLASSLEPNDTETHRALVECCDKQNDKAGAIRQLLESVQLSRRDITLYKDLGRRLSDLQRPQEAERAYTSIVEVLPTESESHTLLAELRQEQNRWPDAIVQWRQVARIRELEPTGLLKLTTALIHEKQWPEAVETLRQISSRGWPNRFGDVSGQARTLEQQIPREK